MGMTVTSATVARDFAAGVSSSRMNAPARSLTVDDFATELLIRKLKRDHVGEENSISAAELVRHLELPGDRELRVLVQKIIREDRVPIVSTFSGGYCIAEGWDDEAFQHCIAQRRSVEFSNRETADAVMVAMEDWYGPPRLFEVSNETR